MYYAHMTVAFLALGFLFYLYKLAKLESERLKPRVRIMKRGHNQFVAQIYLVNKMIWESKPSPTRHHAMQRAEGKIDYEKWR
nr:MAG TPA: hypothetical protein [Caudoviricetes sp.]